MHARLAVLRLAAACVLAGSGCGRARFDELGDAGGDGAGGHDEDGDGFPDSIDPCPHVAGDLADADGDGVGDACDPQPNTPSEHYLMFRTMQPGDGAFDDASMWEQQADALHTTQNTGQIITVPLRHERVEIGFEILGLVGVGQHQIAAGIQDSTQMLYYFVELNDNGATRDAGIFSYDPANSYTTLDARTIPSMHAGVGFLRFDAVTGSTPRCDLLTGWVGELYNASAATPSYTGGDKINFVTNGLDISIRYLAIIETN